jgi:hypothetical protein
MRQCIANTRDKAPVPGSNDSGQPLTKATRSQRYRVGLIDPAFLPIEACCEFTTMNVRDFSAYLV